jgi:hypothetical protein
VNVLGLAKERFSISKHAKERFLERIDGSKSEFEINNIIQDMSKSGLKNGISKNYSKIFFGDVCLVSKKVQEDNNLILTVYRNSIS